MDRQFLHFHLLGDFLLLSGTTLVTTLQAPRLHALLTLLLLRLDVPQERHHLAYLLWPGSSEQQALTNLRNLLFQLRNQLPQADALLAIERHTIMWRSDPSFTLDVDTFAQALAKVELARRHGDLSVVRAGLEEAIGVYKGDLLPSCYDEWILPERERLRQHYLTALEELITLLDRQRDYSVAVLYAQRLVQAEPLDERAYLRLMRLQVNTGDRAAALLTYRRCAATLGRELGVEPDEELCSAYARLLAPYGACGHQKPADRRTLIGRGREWARLVEAWHEGASRGSRVALISGEAGIGKSYLADQLYVWVESQGYVAVRADCFQAEADLHYRPVVSWLHQPCFRLALTGLAPCWLAELARLAPDLVEGRAISPPAEPLTEGWQRRRLFEGLARAVLGAPQPLLLLIDNLQWCDEATLAWLHYLLHYDPDAALLLVCTARAEDLSTVEAPGLLLASLHERGQLTQIELGPLDEDETAALAAQIVGNQLDPEQRARLYQLTEGNPLFVVECIQAALDAWRAGRCDEPVQASDPAGLLTPRLHAVLSARLSGLSPPTRELLTLAATIGRVFGYALLARASGLDAEQLVSSLDELLRRRIVCERGEHGYVFSHGSLHGLIVQQLSAARRQLLERRVTAALSALPARSFEHVFERGGAEGPLAPAH